MSKTHHKTVDEAWGERLASPEHAQDHHNLLRNSHPHALEALGNAFRAGWDAKPDAPPVKARAPAKRPRK